MHSKRFTAPIALAAAALAISPALAQARPGNGHACGSAKAGQTQTCAKHGARARVHALRTAMRACRAERKADPAAFRTKYQGPHGHAAFAHCVVEQVRAARHGGAVSPQSGSQGSGDQPVDPTSDNTGPSSSGPAGDDDAGDQSSGAGDGSGADSPSFPDRQS